MVKVFRCDLQRVRPSDITVHRSQFQSLMMGTARRANPKTCSHVKGAQCCRYFDVGASVMGVLASGLGLKVVGLIF